MWWELDGGTQVKTKLEDKGCEVKAKVAKIAQNPRGNHKLTLRLVWPVYILYPRGQPIPEHEGKVSNSL